MNLDDGLVDRILADDLSLFLKETFWKLSQFA